MYFLGKLLFMKKITLSLLLICSFVITSHLSAQSLPIDSLKNQLVKEWQRSKDYTDSYLETMPADKYSFKAVDSIRSFAQQMLHLAQANVFLVSAGIKSDNIFDGMDLEHASGAQTKDSVKYYVDKSYDYVISTLQNTSGQQLLSNTSLFGMQMPGYLVFMKTLEHQAHHRGQTTIYIRLQGIRPPNERLF